MGIIPSELVRDFFEKTVRESIIHFEKLPKSGGDRVYFRVITPGKSYIATYNDNVRENETFFYFTNQFRSINAPVPEIYKIHPEKKMYLQEDLGTVSLLNELEQHGENEYVFTLFQKSLNALAHLQILADRKLDYSRCLTSEEFGKQAIMNDLLYFKYYFLDTLKIPYEKEKLFDDFEALSNYLTHVEYKYFMFRDFQSRNIYIRNNDVFFIDYQGGMKGALHYDAASMIWQARANLSNGWKSRLLEHYMDCVNQVLGRQIDRARFVGQYSGYVLIRILQVLGAYGFRGLFERKAQFLTSIPLALNNLKWSLAHNRVGIALPEFERLMTIITSQEVVDRFVPLRADQSCPLIVKINSFSYKKGGIPPDGSDNGGGFVFDCRGISNPGRLEEFRRLTGRDKAVMDFLEQRTKMPEFLNGVYNILDISVEDYIKRGFSSLMISFGCTGGQHRSVYAADAATRYLRNKFKVKIELHHIEQGIFEKKGFD